MFKKALVVFILFLYLATGTGFTMNAHYCFGLLRSVSLSTGSECSCGKVKSPCCKTNSIKIIINDKHQAIQAFMPVAQQTLLLATCFKPYFLAAERPFKYYILSFSDHFSPFKEPLYLQNRALRI